MPQHGAIYLKIRILLDEAVFTQHKQLVEVLCAKKYISTIFMKTCRLNRLKIYLLLKLYSSSKLPTNLINNVTYKLMIILWVKNFEEIHAEL